MAYFKYKVKNEYGESVGGKVEAKNREQAAAILRNRGLIVISVTAQGDDGFSGISNLLFGVKQNDIVNLTRQLSTMITAGLPLTEGLSILEVQSKPAVKKLIGDLLREIENGSTFAKALEKEGTVFSKVYIQLVRAGETGGVLDEVLQRLADNMEKAKEFRSKTQGALIYPIIVVIAMLVVVTIMMIFVIPKLTEMYKDFGADLPFATQLLIDISSLFQRFWWLVGAAGVGGAFFFRSWGKTAKGRYAIDKFMLRMPLFGILRQKVVLTEFSRTLSLLLGAGISLLEALKVTTDAMDNAIYEEALKNSASQVEKGVALGQTINDVTIFPPILAQMVTVGEQTGKLDEVLMKLSSYFQSESEQAVKNLTTAIEPMLMVILGLGVAVIMIAIIMPIYNLTSQF